MNLEQAVKKVSTEIYTEVYKQAIRSPMQNFKTGAVIFHPKNGILSKGCSHVREGLSVASVHAEAHAIESAVKENGHCNLYHIMILSIGKAGNPAFSSKPCLDCINKLWYHDVLYVYYLERLNDGQWTMNIKNVEELRHEAFMSKTRSAYYAKDMRVE